MPGYDDDDFQPAVQTISAPVAVQDPPAPDPADEPAQDSSFQNPNDDEIELPPPEVEEEGLVDEMGDLAGNPEGAYDPDRDRFNVLAKEKHFGPYVGEVSELPPDDVPWETQEVKAGDTVVQFPGSGGEQETGIEETVVIDAQFVEASIDPEPNAFGGIIEPVEAPEPPAPPQDQPEPKKEAPKAKEKRAGTSKETKTNGGTPPVPDKHKYKKMYGCMVVCEDEDDQKRIYEELVERGYSVRVVAV